MCQSIYWSLLSYLDGDVHRKMGPAWYVRTLMLTKNCSDAPKGIAEARKEVRESLGTYMMDKVEAECDTTAVLIQVHKAINPYLSRHRIALRSAQDWKSWIAYGITQPMCGKVSVPGFDDNIWNIK